MGQTKKKYKLFLAEIKNFPPQLHFNYWLPKVVQFIQEDDVASIKLLVEAGFDAKCYVVAKTDSGLLSLVGLAANYVCKNSVSYLLSVYPDLVRVTPQEEERARKIYAIGDAHIHAPLILSISKPCDDLEERKKQETIALALLAHGADPNTEDQLGVPIIVRAIEFKLHDLFELLVTQVRDINHGCAFGINMFDLAITIRANPLFMIILQKDYAGLKTLLQHKPSLYFDDRTGKSEAISAVVLAIQMRWVPGIDLLCDAGADVHQSVQGKNLLELAWETGEPSVIQTLSKYLNRQVNNASLENGVMRRVLFQEALAQNIKFLRAVLNPHRPFLSSKSAPSTQSDSGFARSRNAAHRQPISITHDMDALRAEFLDSNFIERTDRSTFISKKKFERYPYLTLEHSHKERPYESVNSMLCLYAIAAGFEPEAIDAKEHLFYRYEEHETLCPKFLGLLHRLIRNGYHQRIPYLKHDTLFLADLLMFYASTVSAQKKITSHSLERISDTLQFLTEQPKNIRILEVFKSPIGKILCPNDIIGAYVLRFWNFTVSLLILPHRQSFEHVIRESLKNLRSRNVLGESVHQLTLMQNIVSQLQKMALVHKHCTEYIYRLLQSTPFGSLPHDIPSLLRQRDIQNVNDLSAEIESLDTLLTGVLRMKRINLAWVEKERTVEPSIKLVSRPKYRYHGVAVTSKRPRPLSHLTPIPVWGILFYPGSDCILRSKPRFEQEKPSQPKEPKSVLKSQAKPKQNTKKSEKPLSSMGNSVQKVPPIAQQNDDDIQKFKLARVRFFAVEHARIMRMRMLEEKFAKTGHLECYLVGGKVIEALDPSYKSLDYDFVALDVVDKSTLYEIGYTPIPMLNRNDMILFRHYAEDIDLTLIKTDTYHWLEEDSGFRCFTIEAVYCDKQGNLIDFHHGIEDIRQRRLRMIGDEALFYGDPIRLLRAIKWIVCQFKPDETLHLAMKNWTFSHLHGCSKFVKNHFAKKLEEYLGKYGIDYLKCLQEYGIDAKINLSAILENRMPILLRYQDGCSSSSASTTLS